MIKDIQQTEIPLNKGIVRTPSVGSDGELSECVGLIPRAGELRVIDNPAPTSVELPEGAVLVFVDRVSGGDNYIYAIGEQLGYIRVKDGRIGSATEIGTSALESTESLPIYSDKYAISSVGNSLIVTGPRFGYVLWVNNSYRSLGASLPQVRLTLSLDRYLAASEYTNETLPMEKGTDTGANYTEMVAKKTFEHYKPWSDGVVFTEKLEAGYSYKITCSGQPGYRIQLVKSDKKTVIAESDNPYELKTAALGEGLDGFIVRPAYYVGNNQGSGYVSFDKGTFTYRVYKASTAGSGVHLKRDQTTLDKLNAQLNFHIAEQHRKGKFIFPFFARYAFRMYDGSIAMPSEPCLMVPNSGPTPRVYFKSSNSNSFTINQEVFSISSCLYFSFGESNSAASSNAEKLRALKDNWGDIIQGIVFYVTPPIYTYDQSVTADTEDADLLPNVIPLSIENRNYTYTFGAGVDEVPGSAEVGAPIDLLFKHNPSIDGASNWDSVLLPPTFNAEKQLKQFTEKSEFYQIHEIDLAEITTEKTDDGYYAMMSIPVKDVSPEIILTKPRLEDSYIFDPLIARKAFAYNQRSILFDVVKAVNFSGIYDPFYQNGSPQEGAEYHVYAHIQTDTGEKVFKAGMTGASNFLWWYWPDHRVKKVVLQDVRDKTRSITFPFKRHDLLPGAYWFDNMYSSSDLISEGVQTDYGEVAEIPYEYFPNKVYTSEVENPFLFTSGAVRIIPSSRIINITTAAKALSEGQLGQFPVYAFCEDGIWAMTVTNEGYLSPAQAIARDIVTNPDSITQLDGAVAFVTSQGLMQIEGSNVTPLSLGMEGRNLDESFIGEAIQKFFGKPYVADTGLFADQVQNCKVLYDYSNQLLHLFGEGTRHYVYSRRDGQWAAQILDKEPVSVVPGYPLSTLQLGNKLYQYAKHTSAPLQEGFALTRSLTLGNPLSRKMIADIRTIGLKTSSDTIRRIAIFGSHDNQNWFPVKSLKSGSAKYYRFLVMARMIDTDTLTGIACRYQERYGHKLR